LIAAKARVGGLVFVCSMPPEPGRSLNEVVAEEPALTDQRALVFRDSVDDEGRYVWPDFASAQYAMYHDCDPDDAFKAFGRLRPQATRPFVERWPLAKWPEVPAAFIVCDEDRMGSATTLSGVAHRRFGVEAVRLDGGHSPFLSRPSELAAAITKSLG
jgi:pimeloyl-ACP methyl ester carboxylesterase